MAYIVTTSKENESTKNEQLVQKEYKNCPKKFAPMSFRFGGNP